MSMPDRIWIDSKPWDDLLCGGWEYEECENADTEYVRKDWLVSRVKELLNVARLDAAALEELGEENFGLGKEGAYIQILHLIGSVKKS